MVLLKKIKGTCHLRLNLSLDVMDLVVYGTVTAPSNLANFHFGVIGVASTIDVLGRPI